MSDEFNKLPRSFVLGDSVVTYDEKGHRVIQPINEVFDRELGDDDEDDEEEDFEGSVDDGPYQIADSSDDDIVNGIIDTPDCQDQSDPDAPQPRDWLTNKEMDDLEGN